MPRRNKFTVILTAALLFSLPATARPRTPVPDVSFDGGAVSAETLGRGGTQASNLASPAAGSENPAALSSSRISGLYGTALVNVSSDLDRSTATLSDPTQGKVLQYLSAVQEKGVVFFEPIARRREIQRISPNSPAADRREVDLSVNAVGFGGGAKMGRGEFGLSVAYLWGSLGYNETVGGVTTAETDTADGLRVNMGARFATGPAMWGLMVQNAPGFLWWKHHRRDQLPVRVRVGNTVRLAKGVLLSADTERRYYREGGREEQFYYTGFETFAGRWLAFRAGLFGTNLGRSEERHATGGVTLKDSNGYELTYAIDVFEEGNEDVRRSLVSLKAPFGSGAPE